MARLRTITALSVAALLALPATDPLTTAGSSQPLDAHWTCMVGSNSDWVTLGVGTSSAFGGSDFSACGWNFDSFNSDGNQYSQAVITKGPSGYEGVGVRLTAGPNGYFVTLGTAGVCTIYSWVGGVRSDITGTGSCAVTWTDGHTLKISASGANPTTITVYDGVTVIGSATDSDIDSGGVPGIIGYVDTGGIFTDWQGDNLGGGGPTYPPAIINAPIRCCGHFGR